MNKLKVTLLAASLGFASISANAVLITEWSYLNDAGFDAYTSDLGSDPIDQTGITATGETLDEFDTMFGGELPKDLAWGNPWIPQNPEGKQSQLVIDDAKGTALGDGTVLTSKVDGALQGGLLDTDWTDGTGLVHNNYGVSGDFLEGALLYDGLFLAPAEPFATPLAPAPLLVFAVLFEETTNYPGGDLVAGSTCAYGDGVTGEVGTDNEFGCSDLFTVVIPDDVSYTQDPDGTLYLSNNFQIDDEYVYTITTRLAGLEAVENVACVTGATCLGFVTVEGSDNELSAAFSITATSVTEPGTLAIFGLGLLGLASVRRRA
ncbi:PEP-CTERM sorting domain-containing protein [Agarivorans sp. TSD2052]|uniref:THxN family PEP-CTERM protein n=1 Tax=Agarivorans sp. TSD2052 TaxID=2937286 RepID=UPI00200F0FA2|nr:THxN family PEP-CTERM protein [Agarivorans sp. TSD2052]UPW19185.1 PEP-CTERM sorting domain-containing protein [Agarivorans sp. TSD2052]